jgi:hypothetical protein
MNPNKTESLIFHQKNMYVIKRVQKQLKTGLHTGKDVHPIQGFPRIPCQDERTYEESR